VEVREFVLAPSQIFAFLHSVGQNELRPGADIDRISALSERKSDPVRGEIRIFHRLPKGKLA